MLEEKVYETISALDAAGAVLLVVAPAYAEDLPPLRTGIDATFAPHAFPNLSGGYQGFNIDLADDLSKLLKRKIVIDDTQYSGLIPAMQARTYDFLIAPTTVTKERAENMLFTEGYLNTDFQFLIKKGAPKIEKNEDSRARRFPSIRVRSTIPGLAILKTRSAGRSNLSAPRPTQCRRSWLGAPMPMSRGTLRSRGRLRSIRNLNYRISIRPGWSGPLRCPRIPLNCARRSMSPSNA